MDEIQYNNEGINNNSNSRQKAFKKEKGHNEQDEVCLVLLEKVL